MRTPLIFSLSLTLAVTAASAQWIPLNPVRGLERRRDGLLVRMQEGALLIEPWSPSVVRVRYARGDSFPGGTGPVVLARWSPLPAWNADSGAGGIRLWTSRLSVVVAPGRGTITFFDSAGAKLFTDDSRTLTPVLVNGESTYHAEMFSSLWGSSEAFFGLGQHQAGVWNYRGESVDLSQDNTNIAVPLLLSSAGYGIFWNNASRSRFNNRFLHAMYLSAEVADAVDYFFIGGPSFDQIIGSYRDITGHPPLFGRWAYGLWQCKNRYATQAEITGVARKYRALHIPVDNIVQDWFWWVTMGEPVFDPERYPDPRTMVADLHGAHFHVMISVWPFFRPGSGTYDDMARRGYFIARTIVGGFHPAGQALYDAFNPQARAYYWHLIDTSLHRIGMDAWWLDTTEPETEGRETNILVTSRVAGSSGARVANLFPLMTTSAVYEGQRGSGDRARVFILSRSAFAGVQRNATAVWSGDVNSDWTFFRKQIPAGLNLSLSGIPYWTTDTGGFVSGNPDDPAYRELFVRWFQFSTFCPILRVHGTRTNNQNELWSYGAAAQKILTGYDRLRYRLLPYLYSVAWMTTGGGYTPMRALVMDFRTDARAAETGDEFLCGPALLAAPVTEPEAVSRRVYLPPGRWYDFWTGKPAAGSRSVDAAAPLEKMPVFVREGSILPLGPAVEWWNQRPADTLEVRIYRGKSGSFTLYEDDGDTYDYEQGAYATIPFAWDESAGRLTIGKRSGEYAGMPLRRTLRIVFTGPSHGAGGSATARADAIVSYAGEAVTLSHRAR
ncbi:MAG TPA: glycoside hydrolase family 31 protein [Bacteroidota bacterium]|nr:glycoside hydrolase family 31 protein [Bacteroidota bacterium]